MSVLIVAAEAPHVLVVEQDATVRLCIEDALCGLCRLSFAVLASTVLSLLLEQSYGLVITATTLPGNFHGLDVLHLVKALPGYDDVPVIGIAAPLHAGTQGADSLVPCYADPLQDFAVCLAGPPDPGLLRQAVMQLLTPAVSLQPG